MKRTKKILALCMTMILVGAVFTSCGNDDKEAGAAGGEISVISREDGSGTRGAFIELLGIETKDADGNKVDNTIETAEITNSTSVMIQTIEGNEAAIGYISLGSLGDTVKALKVDGVEATADNVKSGDYKVSRPFNIVTKKEQSDVTKDFISYIMSEDGQKIVTEEGYVSEGNKGAFKGGEVKGTIKVSGSSSVTPVMEKLAEAYMELNKDVKIEIQQSDSTTGVTDAISGNSDIGMASRALKDEETKEPIVGQAIALDGIAIIVNQNNELSEVTADSVMKIYTGEITKWSDVK